MTDIYVTLAEIIGEELGTAPPPLRPATELDDLPGWDSATFAGVLLAVEERFGVTATREQIGRIRIAADLARLCDPAAV